MGVDLAGLCAPEPVSLEELSGRAVAIDAYNTLYQFLATIRGPDGTPLRDSEGRVTSHLSGLLQRTSALVHAGIRPVFVFDGAPHPLKAGTLQARRDARERAQAEYEAAVEAGDLERARMKAQQTSTLSRDMVEQAKRLIRHLGLPVVQAPGEGEAQASHMTRSGHADAAASQDYDCLLFGAARLVRNLTLSGRRKLPGRQAWVDVAPESLGLAATLAALGLTREQLVDVALLVGTDYNPGVDGIGPKTALKMIQTGQTLEGCFERAPSETGAAWKKLEASRAAFADLATLRDLFLNPRVDPDPRLEWSKFDGPAVLDLLVREHGFAPERVAASLERFAGAPVHQRQKSLEDWG